MAASLVIEDERGVYTRLVRHPHNGYYAGDFSSASAITGVDGFHPTSNSRCWGSEIRPVRTTHKPVG